MSKGSKRRPQEVSDAEMEKRWALAFSEVDSEAVRAVRLGASEDLFARGRGKFSDAAKAFIAKVFR